MVKIDSNKNIFITRGDKAIIDVQVPLNEGYYEFQTTDVLYFTVKNTYNDAQPVLRKILTFEEATTTATFILTSIDTNLGGLSNLPVQYVYDVSINEDQTIIGYDESGPKYLTIYPEVSNG